MVLENLPSPNDWGRLLGRPAASQVLAPGVAKIFAKVASDGDAALRTFTKRFDGVVLDRLTVPVAPDAFEALATELQDALRTAACNIRTFHAAQLREAVRVETSPGVTCWREARPIEKVGLYVPGGSAPLVSSLLMLAIPAQVASCPNVVVCTPPDADGKLNATIAGACALLGIEEVVLVGGAQAIAAMAIGTKSVPQVDLIAGPGNAFVTEAKRQAQQRGIAIDMLAGPSEVLVVGDGSSPAAFAAADLLSQAEHGEDSQVMLVSTDRSWAKAVLEEVQTQLAELPRAQMAAAALNHSRALWCENLDAALAFSNAYAPEHLILASNQAGDWLPHITQAGSVFVGPWSPESAGDYASGPNHTLPTGGTARTSAGVSVDTFVKYTTFQELSPEGLRNLAPTVETLARAEGLDAHKRAVSLRNQTLNA